MVNFNGQLDLGMMSEDVTHVTVMFCEYGCRNCYDTFYENIPVKRFPLFLSNIPENVGAFKLIAKTACGTQELCVNILKPFVNTTPRPSVPLPPVVMRIPYIEDITTTQDEEGSHKTLFTLVAPTDFEGMVTVGGGRPSSFDSVELKVPSFINDNFQMNDPQCVTHNQGFPVPESEKFKCFRTEGITIKKGIYRNQEMSINGTRIANDANYIMTGGFRIYRPGEPSMGDCQHHVWRRPKSLPPPTTEAPTQLPYVTDIITYGNVETGNYKQVFTLVAPTDFEGKVEVGGYSNTSYENVVLHLPEIIAPNYPLNEASCLINAGNVDDQYDRQCRRLTNVTLTKGTYRNLSIEIKGLRVDLSHVTSVGGSFSITKEGLEGECKLYAQIKTPQLKESYSVTVEDYTCNFESGTGPENYTCFCVGEKEYKFADILGVYKGFIRVNDIMDYNRTIMYKPDGSRVQKGEFIDVNTPLISKYIGPGSASPGYYPNGTPMHFQHPVQYNLMWNKDKLPNSLGHQFTFRVF